MSMYEKIKAQAMSPTVEQKHHTQLRRSPRRQQQSGAEGAERMNCSKYEMLLRGQDAGVVVDVEANQIEVANKRAKLLMTDGECVPRRKVVSKLETISAAVLAANVSVASSTGVSSRVLVKQESAVSRSTHGQWDSQDDDSDEESSELDDEQDDELTGLLQDSAPDSTLSTDKSHWKSWTAACLRVKVKPWMVKRKGTAKQKRKRRRKIGFVMWDVHKHMKPRCKSDPEAKPSSSYQVYLGAKRVHKRAGYEMEDGEVAVMAMRALTKRYIQKHGYRSLIKKRREPLTRRMIEAFMSFPEGLKLASLVVNNKHKGWRSWKCLQAAAAQSGFRRDEVSAKTAKVGFTKVQYSRASVVFHIHGEYIYDPSRSQLLQFDDTCTVLLKPRPSKADPTGQFWCDKPICFPYRKMDKVSAARELVQYELDFPLRGAARAQEPLFAMKTGVPFTKSQVDSIFKAMVKQVCPPDRLQRYSFHSYRIYLATMLDKAGCPPDKIKRILRWVSDESLLTYVRDDERTFVKWLDMVPDMAVTTKQIATMEAEAILDYVDYGSENEDEYDYEQL